MNYLKYTLLFVQDELLMLKFLKLMLLCPMENKNLFNQFMNIAKGRGHVS